MTCASISLGATPGQVACSTSHHRFWKNHVASETYNKQAQCLCLDHPSAVSTSSKLQTPQQAISGCELRHVLCPRPFRFLAIPLPAWMEWIIHARERTNQPLSERKRATNQTAKNAARLACYSCFLRAACRAPFSLRKCTRAILCRTQFGCVGMATHKIATRPSRACSMPKQSPTTKRPIPT